jgi:hypothetical protein
MAKRELIEAAFDFLIWGINSGMEDYRLCLNMNEHLGWQFRRMDDIEFYSQQIKGYKHFNSYKYKNKTDLYTIELLQNKNAGNIFIPELKNFEFLFLFHGEDDYFDKEQLAEELRKIPGVQSVIELDVNALKSKNNLLIRHLNDSKEKN